MIIGQRRYPRARTLGGAARQTGGVVRRILVVGGTDSGGGAGLAADVRGAAALGVHAAVAVTAVTAQDSERVHGSWPLPPEAVLAQLRAVAGDIGVDAIKTGMLGTAPIVRAVTAGVVGIGGPLIVDPVVSSTSGGRLLDPEGLRALRELLLPVATVVTPNLVELALLAGRDLPDESLLGRLRAAETLLGLGVKWVVVTGGHAAGELVDLVTDGDQAWEVRGPRILTPHTHGTGCTFATGLACGLALGQQVPPAAAGARRLVTEALRDAYPLGRGPGCPNLLAPAELRRL